MTEKKICHFIEQKGKTSGVERTDVQGNVRESYIDFSA